MEDEKPDDELEIIQHDNKKAQEKIEEPEKKGKVANTGISDLEVKQLSSTIPSNSLFLSERKLLSKFHIFF